MRHRLVAIGAETLDLQTIYLYQEIPGLRLIEVPHDQVPCVSYLINRVIIHKAWNDLFELFCLVPGHILPSNIGLNSLTMLRSPLDVFQHSIYQVLLKAIILTHSDNGETICYPKSSCLEPW